MCTERKRDGAIYTSEASESALLDNLSSIAPAILSYSGAARLKREALLPQVGLK